jgi:hypothetical protein
MTVHGYEIHIDAEIGAIRHYVRSWVLRAVTDEQAGTVRCDDLRQDEKARW